MFQKPFRVKTQTSIKGSDRKKLRAEIGDHFKVDPSILKDVIPNKDEMTVMKIYTHSGDSLIVYNIKGNPAFFEANRTLYPTVYTLWKFPDLLPTFTTWPPVLKKLLGGADLMLPGVVVKGEVTPRTFGGISKGDMCSVKLLGNKAPVAVGCAALSGDDMFGSAMRGKGVLIHHTYQDQLWAFGDKSEPPLIEDTEMVEAVAITEQQSDEDCSTDGASSVTAADSLSSATAATSQSEDRSLSSDIPSTACDRVENGLEGATSEPNLDTGVEQLTLSDITGADSAQSMSSGESGDEEQDPKVMQERMDELLTWCCLCAIKSRVRKSDLPLLTSTFFRNYLQPFCPHGKVVDVKKSSYKKLSKFLKAMQDRGFLRVKELSKGVESIIEVSRDHLELRGFVVPELTDVQSETEPSGGQNTPIITEMFVVTAAVVPFFKLRGQSKGSCLSAPDIRKCLTEYVTEHSLKAEPRGYVTLDPVLSDVVLQKGEYLEKLRWEDLIGRLTGRMTPACHIVFPGQQPVIKKGKLEPITISVAQRGGNKKVTLIHWLEVYGIDPQDFAHRVQIRMACSTSVSDRPGKNQGQEVLVQGNQVRYIGNLLLEQYQIPRKYITGLEKGTKSGKRR